MTKRIQLCRAKGWRKPEGAVIVARPSVYGNPWRMQDVDTFNNPQPQSKAERDTRRRAWAVRQYARELHGRGGTGEFEFVTIAQIRERLAGRDLACWCPLEDEHGNRVPCHADVLLEVANS
jgi:hypothetical protein